MKRLFQPIDNAPLILFRIFFGFLIAAESFGAILTGWVKNVLIIPEFTFSHIGFEWLQPLPGHGMYVYFFLMGITGIGVMLGFKYRWSLGLFILMWTGVYLMQKESYNNHYYLLILVCLIMWFQPAHRYASFDARQNPDIKSISMPQWCSWVMILQIGIVYFFATVAKFYPDWLDGTFTKNLFSNLSHYPVIGKLLGKEGFTLFIAYAGILFDGLIIPALLWRKTRTIAFIASLIFHLFNAVTLQIGIFPFFALSFVVFFYPPDRIRKVFFRKRSKTNPTTVIASSKAVFYFFVPFFILQLLLPIRHYFIKGDVLWTEEGHRLSWRMMLRHRSGFAEYKIVDKKTNEQWAHRFHDRMSAKQRSFITSRPDGIWQYAQHIKEKYKKEGKEVRIFVNAKVSINNKPYKTYIDPSVDFSEARWNYFGHNEWIILYDKNGNPIEN